jgi:cytosine/adenosine deaminase-related metal-dependent hydrolase
MATVNGAAALGETGKIGELSPGAKADLIGIPYDGKARDVWEAIVHDPGHVSISMIDGRWAIAPKTKTSKAIL